jgi:hypothetical protein
MDLQYWTKELRAAELELDAAIRLSDLNMAAQRFQREGRAAAAPGGEGETAEAS